MSRAERNAAYLEVLADRVQSFKDALLFFVELHDRNEAEFGALRAYPPNIFPKQRASKRELHRRREAVSEAAGWAAEAPAVLRNHIVVRGVGALNPIKAWQTITQPMPLLELNDLLDYCTQSIGELRMRAFKVETLDDAPAGFTELHPSVMGAAGALWEDRHYREAVGAAANSVVANLKNRLDRNDVSETALWREAFSEKEPQLGKPRLRWPGDSEDQTTKTMMDGLRLFAPGTQMLVRNSAAHSTDAYTQQDAFERLAVLSLLARLVDQCEIVHADLPSEVTASLIAEGTARA